VEKKTRLWILAVSLLLAAAAGAAIGLAGARHAKPPCTGGPRDREIKELERRADKAGRRVGEAIEGARGAARELDQREKESLERYRELASDAREIAGGLDRIGEDAARAGECLEDLASLIAELQRRSDEEHQ